MFGGPEGVVIIVLLLLLFGGSQLPKLAKNLGAAQKELKNVMDEGNKDTAVTTEAPSTKPDASTDS